MKRTGNRHCPRILSVIDSLVAGGVQRHLLALCRELSRSSHPTDVFSLVEKDDFYAAEIAATGTNVMFGGKSPTDVPIILRRLISTIQTGKYDILHTYLPASYLFGTCIGRWLGVRNIVTTICARQEQIRSRILSFKNYGRLEAMTTTYLTAWPSQLTALRVPAEKIRFSLFATDYELDQKVTSREQNPLVSMYGLEGAWPIILSVGRLHPDKGHDHAIRAHSLLMRSFPQVKLLIVGAGSDENRLRQIARENASGVLFCGVHRRLAPFYSLADIYVNAAINEGLNLSQLQAMAFGLPTVAFDTGNTEYELAGKELAFLTVPLANTDDLAAAVAGVLANPGQYAALIERGRTFASRYEKAHIVRDYLELYESLSGT